MNELLTQRIRVHWNIHRKMWSILLKGKLFMHLPRLSLRDVRFVVQPAGAERAIREQVRNVHAFAEGQFGGEEENPSFDGLKWVIYRAHLGFVLQGSGKRIEVAERVELTLSGACWACLY